MEIILSIDIGYTNPAFVVSYYENNVFKKIIIFKNIKFKSYADSFKYLKYFFSLKITKVLIEQQYIYSKNIALMSYIHGFFMACDLPVVMLSPISKLRTDKTQKSRVAKKNFSINIINNILSKQKYKQFFLKKDNDICDALNLVLYYIYNKKDYIYNFNIPIKKIYLVASSD